MPIRAPSRLADYSRLEKTVFAPGCVRPLHALVVGGGALGNEVVKALALLGFGYVTIVDPDAIEASNLTRSLLLRVALASGYPAAASKAVALSDAASLLFSDTKFTGVSSEIADLGFSRIRAADVIFSCVDSDLARLEIAYISTKLDVPVCDAGLGMENYSHGRVTWFPGRKGACYGCTLSARKRSELLTFWDATIRPCNDLPRTGVYSSTPTMAGITGSLQVEYGLRRFFERAPESSTVEITVDGRPHLEAFATQRSSSCPFHEPPAQTMVPPRNLHATAAEFLKDFDTGAYIALDWPVCMKAECRACGQHWVPGLRAAALRRKGVCSSCGSRDILEQETIRTVEEQSIWAGMQLSAFGVPDQHLITVRGGKGFGE